ncbi:unnamed protein product [Adineta steineri]|uniref:Leucine zipper transcription factor-like protein 1 n=1 Tax=Adineta steineri TaxID=433720 RepID=A0A815U7X7_9BILA|nr:unnamed protein product [Adineta steineri]
MASSSHDLDVNEYHEEILRHYVRFSREQKTTGLRSFHSAAEDFKTQRLSDEAMMTVNEVTEQWFLKLNPNFDQLENRRLIDLIRDYEQQQINTKKSKTNKDMNTVMDPINDTKSTILLKTEIQKLQQLNGSLKQRLSKYEKDDEFLNQQLEEHTRSFSNKEATYTQQIEHNEKRLKDVQQALALAENELEKKFNQTNTYMNMKRIIEQKNQQIKELRQQLAGNNEEEDDD